jgi:hypothetical protein
MELMQHTNNKLIVKFMKIYLRRNALIEAIYTATVRENRIFRLFPQENELKSETERNSQLVQYAED